MKDGGKMAEKAQYNLKKEIFTIPNILVYIRIALIPAFAVAYIFAETDSQYYVAFGIMLVAFLTDFLDGQIARRCNQITNLGKIIDPIADKLYQFSVALCLMVKFSQMVVIAALLFVKEIIMGIMGIILMSKGGEIFGAQWYGKVCTGILDVTMLYFLISPLVDFLPESLMNWLIAVCGIVLIVVSVMYTRLFAEKIKELG